VHAASGHGAVETGARLLLADFWTNPTHTEPLMAALMAGTFRWPDRSASSSPKLNE
jgi:hypothetical protein